MPKAELYILLIECCLVRLNALECSRIEHIGRIRKFKRGFEVNVTKQCRMEQRQVALTNQKRIRFNYLRELIESVTSNKFGKSVYVGLKLLNSA